MPAVDHPSSILWKLTPQHVTQAKQKLNSSQQSYNDTVLALQASMVILGENDDDDTALAYLEDPNLLKILRAVDIENLSVSQQQRHTKYLRNPIFQPTKLARTNEFCSKLCEWNHSIATYQRSKFENIKKDGSPLKSQSPTRYN